VFSGRNTEEEGMGEEEEEEKRLMGKKTNLFNFG